MASVESTAGRPPRKQLASSVDLAPTLVTLGNRGSVSWMRGRYVKIYGERLNLVALLSNPRAAGRDHVLFATATGVVAGDLEARAGQLSGVLDRDQRVHLQPTHWSEEAQDGAGLRRGVLT